LVKARLIDRGVSSEVITSEVKLTMSGGWAAVSVR
jgi:hypothetical protein